MHVREHVHHEHFEELCALAALGQISAEDFAEFRAHLTVCAPCRTEHADYIDLLHTKLPLIDSPSGSFGKLHGLVPQRNKYKKRFLTEARKRGIDFSAEVERSEPVWEKLTKWSYQSFSYKYAIASMVLFFLLVIGVLGLKLNESNARRRAGSTEIAELNSRNEILRRQVADLSRARNPPATEASKTPAPFQVPIVTTPRIEPPSRGSGPDDLLASELSKAQDEYAAMEARSKALEEQLRQASAQAQALQVEAEAAKNTSNKNTDETVSKLRETERALAQMTEEIKNLRDRRASDATAIAAQEARVNELSGKVREQTETLERERQLLTAGRDIRDLMGARNLHIIDVYDVDGKGKTKRSFGRVFYTEGRSLIFYAFDLGNKKASQEYASFQAWGYRDTSNQSVKSLGIFYVDNRNQNRWVLKFNDPNVLAQIDAVFVTIEPRGGSAKPTGQRLLYAYLNNRPNHP
ncbi:MAG TPA: hypothetical protein VJ023_13150 [Pyrinomonadaceae bacterium]|nr:hypothetical protein [Pyrinomonadaceae bacterium]